MVGGAFSIGNAVAGLNVFTRSYGPSACRSWSNGRSGRQVLRDEAGCGRPRVLKAYANTRQAPPRREKYHDGGGSESRPPHRRAPRNQQRAQSPRRQDAQQRGNRDHIPGLQESAPDAQIDRQERDHSEQNPRRGFAKGPEDTADGRAESGGRKDGDRRAQGRGDGAGGPREHRQTAGLRPQDPVGPFPLQRPLQTIDEAGRRVNGEPGA